MTVKISRPAINIQEELADLRKPTGIAGEAMLRAETPQEQQALIGVGRKNLIINGGFKISQRGSYTSATAFTTDTYYLDRWQCLRGSVTGTVQETSVTIGGVSKKAVKVASTGAGSQFMGIRQHVELANIPVGETLTASMWVRTNSSYTRFRTNTFGGSASQSPTFQNDGQWHKVSWSFDSTGTTTNGDLMICFYGDSGLAALKSGDYVEFTDAQLEAGSVATPFEYRSYGEELALCQRYYQRYSDTSTTTRFSTCMAWTSNRAMLIIPFHTEMRSAPSLTKSGDNALIIEKSGSSYTSTVIATNVQSSKSCSFLVTIATNSFTPNYAYMASILTGRYIAFDAEL